MSRSIPKRLVTRRKYLKVQQRFNELYNVERIRYDDVIQQLMKEFFCSHESSIINMLGTKIPDDTLDTDQMTIFDVINEEEKKEPIKTN